MLVGKFCKEPPRGIKILLWGHGLKFYALLRASNSETTHSVNAHSLSDEL